MQIRSSTLDAIGNTPLIKLRRASEETGCTILGKAEFMNPGLSVKDRAALGIVTNAIRGRTAGTEIWEQTDGTVDGCVSAVCTGGTLAGGAAALRERSKDVFIALADVPGAALYSYYTTGELKSEGSSITEGIGQ